jgi:elongation factor G
VSEPAGMVLVWLDVTPRTAEDGQRLALGLEQLLAEDAALQAQTDAKTGHVIIGGQGELHLEVVLGRLKDEFRVGATVGRPRVAFRERVTRPADGEMKYATQDGGRRHYGHVKLHVYPGKPGTGCVFENRAPVGSVPSEYVKFVDAGVRDALAHGTLAGYPIDDVRIQLYDGSYHDIDSSPFAFRIAGLMAFETAERKAKPVLLEPVMHVEVVVPDEHAGDVMGNLSRRRGQIQAHDNRGAARVIEARVPLAGMLGYAIDLRSRTFGRGTFSMQLEGYDQVPPPNDQDGGRDSLVGAPLRPAPKIKSSSVALPEPDDDRIAE